MVAMNWKVIELSGTHLARVLEVDREQIVEPPTESPTEHEKKLEQAIKLWKLDDIYIFKLPDG
jgi:hypothetical protein